MWRGLHQKAAGSTLCSAAVWIGIPLEDKILTWPMCGEPLDQPNFWVKTGNDVEGKIKICFTVSEALFYGTSLILA